MRTKKWHTKDTESVSDALTTAETDPQQYEIYFFQDNKAKKKS